MMTVLLKTREIHPDKGSGLLECPRPESKKATSSRYGRTAPAYSVACTILSLEGEEVEVEETMIMKVEETMIMKEKKFGHF